MTRFSFREAFVAEGLRGLRAAYGTKAIAHVVIGEAPTLVAELAARQGVTKLTRSMRRQRGVVALLDNIEVDVDRRDRGIGTKLLRAILDRLDRRGVTATYLWAIGDLSRLEPWYRAHGFRTIRGGGGVLSWMSPTAMVRLRSARRRTSR